MAARKTPKRPPRYGKPYEDAEIALVYLVERSDKARELLAKVLGRTEGAIDLVWRWVDHADFPPEAHNRIMRQVEWAEVQLGAENRGKISVE
jgi:hypothetical protein